MPETDKIPLRENETGFDFIKTICYTVFTILMEVFKICPNTS